jgi:hypothetical protein
MLRRPVVIVFAGGYVPQFLSSRKGRFPQSAANLVDPNRVVDQGRASAGPQRTSHYSGPLAGLE